MRGGPTRPAFLRAKCGTGWPALPPLGEEHKKKYGKEDEEAM